MDQSTVVSIIFLVIAIVVLMRLGSVLGRRTGNEPSPYDTQMNRTGAPSGRDNVVQLPGRNQNAERGGDEIDLENLARYAEPDTPLFEGLKDIAAHDRSFDPEGFLNGARLAYEMIVTAFAEGNKTQLKSLLEPDVYDGFVAAIKDRAQRGERIDSTFVGIESAKLTDAEVDGSTARLSVRFVSELISATRNKAGAVIDGDPDASQTVRDVWTFTRDLKSRDPNWKLAATEAV
ncbi:MAG TPA: Tim44/TimA family putative adaptor protein [Afifellaceae bacterium]|nr:Tim44/TimA family putative adaptor protein [Afifellaceae bacterium]